MFKRREKKVKSAVTFETEVDDGNEESVSEIVHEFKERAKKRVPQTVASFEELEAVNKESHEAVPAFFDSTNQRDLGEYLGKRKEDPKSEDVTFDQQLEGIIKGTSGAKISDVISSKKSNQLIEEDFKKLAEVEALSRQIKEQAKDRAYWSIGMVEVDVGIDRKIANIEATEEEKRKRLIQEYVKTAAANPLKIAKQQPDPMAPTDDIKNWIWKPKDQGLTAKEKEKREMVNMLKAFHKSGKVYKNRKLLGQLGISLDNIGNLKDEDLEDD